MSEERETNWQTKEGRGHYYLCNAAGYAVGEHLEEVIKKFKPWVGSFNTGLAILWWVPGPSDSKYKINYYAPQVEGAYYIGEISIEPYDDPDEWDDFKTMMHRLETQMEHLKDDDYDIEEQIATCKEIMLEAQDIMRHLEESL